MTRSVSYGPSITMSMGANVLHDLAEPAVASDAATKNYVDTHSTSSGGSVTFAAPSLVFSTTNVSGAASTVTASNATLAVFNLLGPATQAFGDTSLTGSAAFAARQDHRHPMPATPVTTINKSGSTALTGAVTLTGGTNVTLTQSGQDISIAASSGGGSDKIDLVERTSDLVVTATSAATAQTFITSNAVTYDGSTQIVVEFYCPVQNSNGSNELIANIWEDTTDLGRVGIFDAGALPAYGAAVRTPSAGSHTYTVRVWKGSGSGKQFSAGSSSASGPLVNAFVRITKA